MLNGKIIRFLTLIRHPRKVYVSSVLYPEKFTQRGFAFHPRSFVKGIYITIAEPFALDLTPLQVELMCDIVASDDETLSEFQDLLRKAVQSRDMLVKKDNKT